MVCWEYDIREIRTDDWDKTKEDLNGMGMDGWELIKFAGEGDRKGTSNAFFKRPVDEANI
jgi:nitrogen regulatory protein PII